MPIVQAATKAVLGFDVAVFEAPSVITDRRMDFLRKADQAIDWTTTPTSIFQHTCAEAHENTDLYGTLFFYRRAWLTPLFRCSPLLAFYEASEKKVEGADEASQELGAATSEQAVDVNMASGGKPRSSIFVRAAVAGVNTTNEVFPAEVDVGTEDSVATSLAEHLRTVQQTHKSVVLHGDGLSEYLPFMGKTQLGKSILLFF